MVWGESGEGTDVGSGARAATFAAGCFPRVAGTGLDAYVHHRRYHGRASL